MNIKRFVLHWVYLVELKLKNMPLFSVCQKARRVYFPGCSLAASSPQVVYQTLLLLRRQDPAIGLWCECCGMPLRKFGQKRGAQREEEALWSRLQKAGVEEVIVACGNCAVELKQFVNQGLIITSVYELLANDNELMAQCETFEKEYVVHHPCPSRIDTSLQHSFYQLADRMKLKMVNRRTSGFPLPCCLNNSPKAKEMRKALKFNSILTYCGHCTQMFQNNIATTHILQLITKNRDVWQKSAPWRKFVKYRSLVRQTMLKQ